jgi:2-C-methyl-D-erythritol 4-phosphate cytidylyltransferase
MPKTPVSVIIVAAGSGTRLQNSIPKAFVPLANKPLFLFSLKIFDKHPLVSDIVLVVPQHMRAEAQELVAESEPVKSIGVIAGGKHRWQSVRNGVMALTAGSQWILVHDAARPFVTNDIIDSLLTKRTDYKCAITATPEVDTLRSYKDDYCTGTIDRSTTIRVGTPQLFFRETLLSSFEKASTLSTPPTDEAMLIESMGIKIGMAWGDPLNFKITTPHDMVIAEALCKTQKKK